MDRVLNLTPAFGKYDYSQSAGGDDSNDEAYGGDNANCYDDKGDIIYKTFSQIRIVRTFIQVQSIELYEERGCHLYIHHNHYIDTTNYFVIDYNPGVFLSIHHTRSFGKCSALRSIISNDWRA